MPADRPLELLVFPITRDLHDHDRPLAGVYPATVPAMASDSESASAVVDAFFRTYPPRRPDDFCYQVFDGQRQLIESAPATAGFVATLGERSAAARL